jgi:hypothetical protein
VVVWLEISVRSALRYSSRHLGAVLPDRHERDALPGAGGGDLRQGLERGDVAGLVQHQQQRRVERRAVEQVGAHIHSGAVDGLDEGDEEWAELGLLVLG